MELETYISLGVFCFVSAITPGPNNIMLMSSGANYGIRSTMPHLLGVMLGFSFLVLMIGVGLVQLFNAFPFIQTLLQLACTAFLIYLAWKIAMSSTTGEGGMPKARPMTFMQAVLFQWINPKAWTMGVAANTLYASGTLGSALIVMLVFLLVGTPSSFFWALLGKEFRRFINTPFRFKVFNYVMAGLLLATLIQINLMQ